VNSNLEVRTSVAINPETGAAEDKALFTYEAIPRAAFLWMDTVIDDYRNAFPGKDSLDKWLRKNEKVFADGERPNRQDLERANWKDGSSQDTLDLYDKNKIAWNGPDDVINSGLELAEHLGVGGMGTRGFGRVRIVHSHLLQTAAEECKGVR
jgi:CRISPR-associated protein Cmr4